MEDTREKLKEIVAEMKALGLWRKEQPEWVNDFVLTREASFRDFAEWLQFVYLPNRLQAEWNNKPVEENLIVMQAVQFFGEDLRQGRLLQLLIELDALL
jgi:uncharacterized protein YqcC (DUF446 family)